MLPTCCHSVTHHLDPTPFIFISNIFFIDVLLNSIWYPYSTLREEVSDHSIMISPSQSNRGLDLSKPCLSFFFICLYHLTFLTIHFIWCRHFKVQRQPKHQCANQQDPIMQVETRTAFLHGCSLQIPPFYTREAPLEPPTFYYWHRVQCACSIMLSLCWSFCKRFGFLLLAVNFIMKIHLTRRHNELFASCKHLTFELEGKLRTKTNRFEKNCMQSIVHVVCSQSMAAESCICGEIT